MNPGHGDGADAGFPSRGRAIRRAPDDEAAEWYMTPPTRLISHKELAPGAVILEDGMEALVLRVGCGTIAYRYLHEDDDAKKWSRRTDPPIRLVTPAPTKEAD